ncbi:uncharacterized protein LOC125380030 [Haliotis rufescens]|uniref:uncharacterized protein LOC125380030 n=1 Tax=Haliotis rufescens TaxID=6454 RepID=UPI00201F3759|nr:uncharacterized protein LOC125380030 [Haliotis rufescens]
MLKDGKWYLQTPVGHSTLQATVKRLCKEAGLEGTKTNHPHRATAATRLYQANEDEQMICEITGHKSEAVRSYKRTSDVQKANMSDILSNAPKRLQSETATTASEGTTGCVVTAKTATTESVNKDKADVVFNVKIS